MVMSGTKSRTWSVYADDGERMVVVAETLRKAVTAAEVAGKKPVAVVLVGADSVVIADAEDTDVETMTESPI
jgi:DUF971 family protein